jgi:hypothetical protein
MVILEIQICCEAAKSGLHFGAQSALERRKVKRSSVCALAHAMGPQDIASHFPASTPRNIALATKDMAV